MNIGFVCSSSVYWSVCSHVMRPEEKMDKIERSERERAEKTQITAFLSYFPCWFIQTELQNTEAFVCVMERERVRDENPQNRKIVEWQNCHGHFSRKTFHGNNSNGSSKTVAHAPHRLWVHGNKKELLAKDDMAAEQTETQKKNGKKKHCWDLKRLANSRIHQPKRWAMKFKFEILDLRLYIYFYFPVRCPAFRFGVRASRGEYIKI